MQLPRFFIRNKNVLPIAFNAFTFSEKITLKYKIPVKLYKIPARVKIITQYLNMRISFTENVFNNAENSLTVFKDANSFNFEAITGSPAVYKQNFTVKKNKKKYIIAKQITPDNIVTKYSPTPVKNSLKFFIALFATSSCESSSL